MAMIPVLISRIIIKILSYRFTAAIDFIGGRFSFSTFNYDNIQITASS